MEYELPPSTWTPYLEPAGTETFRLCRCGRVLWTDDEDQAGVCSYCRTRR